MPSYLVIAYSIFIVVPLALAIYIYVQKRRIERQIARFEKEKDTAPQSKAS
jgi:hypothetical protein